MPIKAQATPVILGTSEPWLMIKGQIMRPMPAAMSRYIARITHNRIGETWVIDVVTDPEAYPPITLFDRLDALREERRS